MPIVTLWDIEICFVEMILIRNNGNRTRSAKDLGVSIRTLRHWISETMDINVPPAIPGRK
jgi:DNA-binding protein Fis